MSSPPCPQVLRLGAGRAWEEDAATFYVDGGAGNPATVVYDYKNVSGGGREEGGGPQGGIWGQTHPALRAHSCW